MATSLSAFLNAGLLFIGLCKAGVYTACPGWRSFLAKIVIANLSLLGFLWTFAGPIETWIGAELGVRALNLAGLVIGGALVYAVVLLALGVRPRDFVSPAR